jgi:hypothetical protein
LVFAAATAEVAAAAAAKLNAYNGLHKIHTSTKGRFDITTSASHLTNNDDRQEAKAGRTSYLVGDRVVAVVGRPACVNTTRSSIAK